MEFPLNYAVHREAYQRLCDSRQVGMGLRPVTSSGAMQYLDMIDEFEQTGALDPIRSGVAQGWPFATRGPKQAAYTDLNDREKDLDLAAVYQALTQPKGMLQPDHLNRIVLYNVLIRRGIEPVLNVKKLHLFVHANLEAVMTDINVRWFVSYCDSLADSASFPARIRSNAALASSAINAIRLAISPYRILAESGIDLIKLVHRLDTRRLPLGSGMITFSQAGGDAIPNHLERSMKVLGCDDAIGLLFRLSIGQLLRSGDSGGFLERLLSSSANPVNKIKLDAVKSLVSAAEAVDGSDPKGLTFIGWIDVEEPPIPQAHPVLTGSEKSFLVLNDTNRFALGFHTGTAAVMSTIQTNMIERGFQSLGSVNNANELAAFSLRGLVPVVVILNGEGTMHHDSKRAIWLLETASRLSELGSRCFLINSIWQQNSEAMTKSLSCFVRVFVRDHLSHSEIARSRPDASICPDLSIAHFMRMERHSQHLPLSDLCVVDSVVDDVAQALWRFASATRQEYLIMGPRNYPVFVRDPAVKGAVTTPWPFTLDRLRSSRRVLSGRFHGALASFCSGLPTLVTESNTFKNQALCSQIDDQIFIPSSELLAMPIDALNELLDERFAIWDDPTTHAKRDAFLGNALDRIDGLFDEITAD